ncbi:MAG: Asp-tRNA(Asn)/Glu-tRNA(Gln) amidotransferase subunit GatC [Anaerolineales bacterium]
MPLSIEEVRHIARLARLELDDEALERYCRQLSSILDYMARLRQVDTRGVPPALGPLTAAPLRPDEARPGLPPEALWKNAPQVEAGQFRIPPVFEGE